MYANARLLKYKKMKKSISLFLFFAVSACMQLLAQQLPDPSFEEWNGTAFNGAIQPTYWHYSNVSQLGIANFNFADRQPGRNGGYCMKVQDQSLTVMGIGETSPGYIALGQPWAYVASLTAINKATAGTYGGIDWTYRPDTMVVWIKREGPRTGDENYNILFYSWVGNSNGTTYKGKDGSCTNVVNSNPQYAVNEESDIRLALDGNECAPASGNAQQVAEGWIYEKTSYPNWTKIKVPIYYLNDRVPEKCNVIFSAGNYPNFRANSGLYEGNSLYVDDAEMIYSSKIQKLYIGGREWRAFDPNSTAVQTYSLGPGVTSIPEVYAVRGAGSLRNNRGDVANFAGRRLSDAECTISGGVIDGAPATITVYAADGSSQTTYQVAFVSTTSSNAKLADIRVNGTSVANFNPFLTSYNVSLPYGTTEAPLVEVDLQDATATVQIQQPASPAGTSVITVTAQDGTQMVYTLSFSVALLQDLSLQDILLDGESLPGFSPSKLNYTVMLAPGAAVPAVTPVSAYPAGAQTITVLSNTLEQGCQIEVRAPGTSQARTYRITYKVEMSENAQLAALFLGGEPLEGFDPAVTTYYVTLPVGTEELPAITFTLGDPYQQVQLTDGGVNGVTRLVVTAGAGNTLTYRINFNVELSDNNALAAIMVEGEPLADFDPEVTDYTVVLPAGTADLPLVTYEQGDRYQTVQLTANTVLQLVRLSVRAADGQTRVYTLHFEVDKSAAAMLRMIYLDGDSLPGFDPEVLGYTVYLDSLPVPHISVEAEDNQSVMISQVSGYSVASITVRPSDGADNVYTISFRRAGEPELPEYEPDSVRLLGSNALLSALYIGGQPFEAFRPDVHEYTDTLPYGTTQMPMVYPVAGEYGQVISVTHGPAGTEARIHVVAADGVSSSDYLVRLPIHGSSNTLLGGLEVDGADWTFSPEQTYYEVNLPYGTTVAPAILFEKGEPEQTIELHVAPLSRPSEVIVIAADGSRRTYQIRFRVARSEQPSNALLNVLLAGDRFIDLTATADSVFMIDLPFGTDTVGILSYTKAYPEQRVVIEQSAAATRIMAFSDVDNTPARTYTFIPVTAPSPLMMSSLSVDGEPLSVFSPEQLDYLLHVDTVPAITFTLANPDSVEAVVTVDSKHWQCSVQKDDFSRVYTVWFHYPNDTIPNADFSEWTTALYNEAAKPLHWQVPADFAESFTYNRNTYTFGDEVKQHGDTVLLTTIKKTNPLGGSFPGMMTLGQMSITPARSNGTKSSISGGIPFRNTPDSLIMGYRPIRWSGTSNSNMHVLVHFRGEGEAASYEFNDPTFNGAWKTMRLPLSSANGVVAPTEMNITINSAHSENASDLKQTTLFIFTNYPDCSMDVDHVRFAYDSRLRGMSVGGNQAVVFDTIRIDTIPSSRIEVDSVPSFRVDVDSIYEHILLFDTVSHHEIEYDTIVVDSVIVDRIVIDSIITLVDTFELRDVLIDTVRFNVPVYDTIYFDVYDTVPYIVPSRYELTLPADVIGVPDLRLDAPAPDQIHTVTWTEWQGNEISAHIRSMAEDSTFTDYFLHAVRPVSANTSVAYRFAEGDELHVTPLSPYQTISVECTDTACLIHVTAENGDTLTHVALLPSYLAEDSVFVVPSEEVIEGESTARLLKLFVDGRQLDEFAPAVREYTLAEDGVLQHQIEFSLDTLVLSVTDSLYVLNVLGADTSSLYLLRRQMASEARLSDLRINGRSVAGFDSDIRAYEWLGTELLSVSATTVDPLATYAVSTVPVDSAHTAVFVEAFAQDGSSLVYSVMAELRPLGSSALLEVIYEGADTIEGFSPDVYDYEVLLPAGALIPSFSAVAADDASLTTELLTDDDLHTRVVFEVVSADKSDTARYTVTVEWEPFEISELLMIYLDGQPVEGFSSDPSSYEVHLPSGTALLPQLTFDLAERHATVQVDTAGHLSSKTVLTFHLLSTAQDGIHTSEYSVSLIVEKSAEARLRSIALGGVQLDEFDPDVFTYHIDLPYGTTAAPEVTFALMNDSASAELSAFGLDSARISVLAEDGVTAACYRVLFTVLRSSCATLRMISADGEPLTDFAPDQFDYSMILPYEAPVPTFTWLTSDEQQQVTGSFSEAESAYLISVTAGNGAQEQYRIALEWLLSPNNYLADLAVRGATIAGFHRDTVAYTVTYPAGTPQSELLTVADVTCLTEDPDATVSIAMQDDHTITLSVTAPNGDLRVYVITQVVLLDEEARLQMIWLDDEPLRGFSPDVFTYVVELVQGATVPDVTALPLSDLGDVEYGALSDTDEGQMLEIDGVAENGARLTYSVLFRSANWSASPDVTAGEYLFMHIPGTDTYRAVTLGLNVTVAVYTADGRLVEQGEVPTADPNDVRVEVDGEGKQHLVEAYPTADGYDFRVPELGKTYFYVFFDVRHKRVAKGGKFALLP